MFRLMSSLGVVAERSAPGAPLDIDGTPAADLIAVRELASVMAGDGNDLIIVFTETGAFIDAGAGNDLIMGSAGPDTIKGGEGADTILAGDGHDLIYDDLAGGKVNGGAGWDQLFLPVGLRLGFYLERTGPDTYAYMQNGVRTEIAGIEAIAFVGDASVGALLVEVVQIDVLAVQPEPAGFWG